MTALRLLLAALFIAAAPVAQAQTAPDTPKPTKAERKAQKKEEIAREKAAVATPLDAKAAMDARVQMKEKRASCKLEAKAKGLGFTARRAFVKECEAG